MTNYNGKFENLLNELSDDGFEKLKGWMSYSFADVTEGFDQEVDDSHEEYLDGLKNHINYLQNAYKIKAYILKSDRNDLLSYLDLSKLEVQENINESVTYTLQDMNELDLDCETYEKNYDEMIERDIEVLSTFLD